MPHGTPSSKVRSTQVLGAEVVLKGDTIAEGLAVRDVGDLTFSILSSFGIEILLVEEEAIEQAIVSLIEIEKTVAEGAGAAGLAALRAKGIEALLAG